MKWKTRQKMQTDMLGFIMQKKNIKSVLHVFKSNWEWEVNAKKILYISLLDKSAI